MERRNDNRYSHRNFCNFAAVPALAGIFLIARSRLIAKPNKSLQLTATAPSVLTDT
jgi:hypothetical protein